MAENEMVVSPPNSMAIMPAFSIAQAIERRKMQVEFVKELMVLDVDYGAIPGTGTQDKPGKKVLLKPGAEKLISFFGLRTEFVIDKEEDWDGDRHKYNGEPEPFLSYIVKCRLFHGDMVIAEADAGANSREGKWRWRQGQRVCPDCGMPAIIKGKEQYGGGWLCFAKKNGCGAKFQEMDPRIIEQEVGRILNPDIYDLQNTMIKIAEKRAYVAATLLGTNASEFFTQDLEEQEPRQSRSGITDPDVVDADYRDERPAQSQQSSKPHVDMGKLRKSVMVEFQRVTGGKTNTGKNDSYGRSALARLNGHLSIEGIEGGPEALATLTEEQCKIFLKKLKTEPDWKPKTDKPSEAEAQPEHDPFGG